jgi:hypothetical protein
MTIRAAAGITMLIVALAATAAGATDGKAAVRASLVTIEGTVSGVTALPGEGDLPVVAVSLVTDGDTGDETTVLLGPEQALDEIGFAVAPGDRCRVRVFRSDDGLARAHKVLNATRGTMVRLRTLHQVPLWDGRGVWQGGPCRGGQGSGAGRRYRGGR